MNARVIKNTGSWYTVRTEHGETVQCKIKGNFRLKGIRSTNPVAVGDWVDIDMVDSSSAYITKIHPRKNYIIRKASNLSKQSHIIATNLDQTFLVITVNYPITTTTFIDRFLATAEAYSVPVKLLFNKIDRYSNPNEMKEVDSLISLYESIGYPCMKISAETGEGIDALLKEINELSDVGSEKVILFSGHSGVGKSTIINKIIPNANLRTANISKYHGTGMHTTTFSEMIPIKGGGWLIDTPGIKGFGTIEMQQAEIGHYFPEIFEISKGCRFDDCAHTHEPHCAIRQALEEGRIYKSRYLSYLSILNDKNNGKYREEHE